MNDLLKAHSGKTKSFDLGSLDASFKLKVH
ncbi:MAG: hypothetical protein UX25_C0019G0001 [Candidatus Woesebacteria bacterium GW2011_GWC2_45_9]|uniref:Uncharacterized protein n=1 Tax=Candidatus Woesebacteria bacterium GW2011_GWC2_45_9 TaxID=1618589 RepID=A0A0G1QGW0_9BACT|nr:MAG: hypothetical protein UX25_C0019G0001 [Candidatus Woesebacteria bacterium GW2011_GWC2_45_9]